jgi:hypothetical protein
LTGGGSGLGERYDLPWEKEPLSKPGEGAFYHLGGGGGTLFAMLSLGYIFIFALIFVLMRPRGQANDG